MTTHFLFVFKIKFVWSSLLYFIKFIYNICCHCCHPLSSNEINYLEGYEFVVICCHPLSFNEINYLENGSTIL